VSKSSILIADCRSGNLWRRCVPCHVSSKLGADDRRNCCSIRHLRWSPALCAVTFAYLKFRLLRTHLDQLLLLIVSELQSVCLTGKPLNLLADIQIGHQSVFGSAYALKITMNNALVFHLCLGFPILIAFVRMNIIVRVVTGVLQDASPANNPYEKVTPVYVVLSVLSLSLSLLLFSLYYLSNMVNGRLNNIAVDIGRLQWTRKQRLERGPLMKARKLAVGGCEKDPGAELESSEGLVGEPRSELALMQKISFCCFGGLCLLVLGSWAAYFWGVATGNN